MKHLLLATIAAVVVVGTAIADPIHDAVNNGDLAGVQAELDKGVDVNAKHWAFGGTPLHQAVIGDHKEIAELLIANGADLNAKDTFGGTPLHQAAFHGHKEIAELLITNGADVNAKYVDGKTPLFGGYFNAGLIELLIKNGANPNLAFTDHFGIHHTVIDWYHTLATQAMLDQEAKNDIKENANLIRKLGGKKYYELNPLEIAIFYNTVNNKVYISVYGIEGSTFDVLHSSNLNNWKVLKTGTIGMNRSFGIESEITLGSSFYKIRPTD